MENGCWELRPPPQLLWGTCAFLSSFPLIQLVALGGAEPGEERQSPALGEPFSAKEAETSIHGNCSLTQSRGEQSTGTRWEHGPAGLGVPRIPELAAGGGCLPGALGSSGVRLVESVRPGPVTGSPGWVEATSSSQLCGHLGGCGWPTAALPRPLQWPCPLGWPCPGHCSVSTTSVLPGGRGVQGRLPRWLSGRSAPR